jgi:hypothetical protein
MAGQCIKVVPPALLSAAAVVAGAAQKAATPGPGAVPVAAVGSPADDALTMLASGIATQVAEMSAQVWGEGPALQAKTSAGVAQLEAQDADDAAQIRAVGESERFSV